MIAEALASGRMHAAVPVMLQAEAAECGLACLAMVAAAHGHDVDVASLRRRFPTSLAGMSLARMIEIADALGFEARAQRCTAAELRHGARPCILHWNGNHFVVLVRVTRSGAEIHDPAQGRVTVSHAELAQRYSGVVLELARASTFVPVQEARRISLRALMGRVTSMSGAVLQLLALSLAIELLALLLPFHMQWTMDHVIVSADANLLVALAGGFVVLAALQTALGIARGWVLSWLGVSLNAQWVNNLFGHLMRLPVDFFEKRHTGDILSRFSSVRTIQDTLTGQFVEAILDGVTASLTLAILLFYSPRLTLIVLAALALYMLMRYVGFRRLRRLSEEQLVFEARQQTELMESVRGARAIKLANKQGERRARLARATVDAAARELQLQRTALVFLSLQQGLGSTQRVVLVALGAYFVLQEQFSVGMVLAFVAFADQFIARTNALVDKSVEFGLLRLQAERIADIALTAPEDDGRNAYTGSEPVPTIELVDVSFRYADGEPLVLRNVNLRVEAGESVAIVGPSGCGKSTLVKLLLGLLEPTEGRVLVGGIDIRTYGLARYREMLGVVLQDDQLFAGSIASNIAFFDASATTERVVAAATAAAIHDEIREMTMGYETLVGDMGSSLSGGQKQRIVLARALYRNPRILVLDEATSHLDHANTVRIDARIRALDVTRILIAHSLETLTTVDRCVELPGLGR